MALSPRGANLTRHRTAPRKFSPRLASRLRVAASSSQGILVTGATGGTGKAVVEKLASEEVIADVAVFTRNATKARATLPSSVGAVIEGDLFDYEATLRAVSGRETVLICSGTTSRSDVFDPLKVDWQGVENIVAACKQSGVKKIVMVSSIGVDDPFFPLNLLGGVLWMKKLGELAVQRSGIDYTIIRPGGLRSKDEAKEVNVVAGRPNTFGLPPRPKLPGGIRRTTVAEACVAAMRLPEARNKVIEIIEEERAPYKSWRELFVEVS